MKQTTRIAVAGLLSAAGAALQAIASEIGGATPAETSEPTVETSTQAEVQAPTKKPRKAAAEKPVGTVATPAEPEARPDPVVVEVPAGDGETQEEKDARYTKNRALIEPLVKGVKKEGSETEYAIQPQGQAVKAIIKKHSPTEKLPDLPLDKQADFEGDLEALTM